MSKLDELIQQLCPNGVEYKKIGEIFDIITDYTAAGSFADIAKNVKYSKSPEYAQLIRTTDIKSKFTNNSSFVYIDEKAFKYLWKVNIDKESIIMPNVGNCGEVYYIKPEILPNKYNVLGPNAILMRANNYNLKFLYYCLDTRNFKKELTKITSTTGQTKFNKTNLKELLLPVPPLEVQDEIVRILDKFTELSAEHSSLLSKELNLRKKQYEYYRDELLSFKNEKYPQMKLADIAIEMYRGAGIKRTEVTEDGISCVRYGEIYTTYNITFSKCVSHTNENIITSKKYFEYGDVLFAITGENVEEIGKSIVYLGNERCLAGGDIVVMKHKQNPKYMAYALSTTMSQMQKSKGKVKSKVVHSSVPSLQEITLPIPPLNVQEKIANILEKFYLLCNDISQGLPAEIELRQKQYEYYRDKLLTFKELKVNE